MIVHFAPLRPLFAVVAATVLYGAISHGALVYPSQNAYAEDDGAGAGIRVRPNNSPPSPDFRYTEKSWVKFDLTGQNADSAASATFTVYFDTLGAGNGEDPDLVTAVHGLNTGYTPETDVNGTGEDEFGTGWTESDFTSANHGSNAGAWQLAPENDQGSSILFESQTTKIGTFDLDPNGDESPDFGSGTAFSVTLDTLGDFIQSDNTVTLMLAGNAGLHSNADSRRFFDRQDSDVGGNDYRPTLDFSVIPEPGTLGLLLLGGTGLLRRRRS